ncbi:MAG: CTP synthase, partial [Candidatus Latescibacteria bacterium]|nr:CTP synthase [Candidatus Latescibacterota bacterium]
MRRAESYTFPKFIVVAGGVISGVGKGLATASIGKILQQAGYSVTAIKIDPYINYDAGTMRPTEHGEVWVTDDGGEIDQDLGNYERFLGIEIPRTNNITTGQIYKTVIDRERRGEYLGQTVQPIPHITDEIKRRITAAAAGHEIALIEVGGTIGDYENTPFFFAVKSLEREIGDGNLICVLVTYLPVPGHIHEMKTKPTQHGIKLLSEHGIFPDFILCRGPQPLDAIRKGKIETYANIDIEHIISAPDVTSVYSIPLNFEQENIGRKILEKLELESHRAPDWVQWETLVANITEPTQEVRIAMVGKYATSGEFSLEDAYVSVNHALDHAGATLGTGVRIDWVNGADVETGCDSLGEYDGILVPGAFGASGADGMIAAIRLAREEGIPYLGICYGLQMAVVEYAQNVCDMNGANSTEINADTPHPVIDLLDWQREVLDHTGLGGTMRLGAYAAVLVEGSVVETLYSKYGRMDADGVRIQRLQEQDAPHRIGRLPDGCRTVLERHRHRYEVSPQYVQLLSDAGLVFSGLHETTEGTKLMEFIELPNHPFFAATQAH